MSDDRAVLEAPWNPAWIAQVRDHGDRAAAEQLARRACRLALRTAAAILHDRDAAFDIAQDVALDVLRSLGALREPDAFDAWVHRITVRHALRHARRRQRRSSTETPLTALADGDQPAAHGDPEGRLAVRSVLALAIAQLPPRQQLALALRYVHDLSDEEIAAALRCRVGTVHALLSRGRTALRHDPAVAELAPALLSGGIR
jgi:RNA polymerase sigma factor (sigma-70 family)